MIRASKRGERAGRGPAGACTDASTAEHRAGNAVGWCRPVLADAAGQSGYARATARSCPAVAGGGGGARAERRRRRYQCDPEVGDQQMPRRASRPEADRPRVTCLSASSESRLPSLRGVRPSHHLTMPGSMTGSRRRAASAQRWRRKGPAARPGVPAASEPAGEGAAEARDGPAPTSRRSAAASGRPRRPAAGLRPPTTRR